MNAKQFIDKVKGSSNILWNTYKILPSVAIAQACLESGWGSSSLATKYNNLFGIKGSFNGQTTNMKTWESYGGVRYDIVANFRSYPDWETSIKDYGVFLNVNSRYKNALGITNPKQQIKAIHEAGYATDPNYQNKIMAIIAANNLTQYDSVVQGNQVSSGSVEVSSTLYVVRSGDNLSTIAQKYKTTVNEIVRLNNIKNPNLIQVGQKLTIKGQSPMKMHIVQSGDTVSGLALKYGSSQSQIKGWNNLANINVISIGQKLRVK